jgi:CO/xanthine dehydrogenase FAD-binding subunit
MGLYLRPTTLDEAVRLLAQEKAQILSGGTDFYPSLGDRPMREPVVDISGLGELGEISVEAHQIRIGGLATWTKILQTPLPRCFDALKGAARQVGSIQIQNRGTVAGNLCNASPAADGVPPLLVLDPEVELVSQEGTRRIPLAEFIVGNRKTQRRANELLTGILIPRTLDDAASTFLKLGARRYLVISIAMVAVVLQVDNSRITDCRVAVGSCSAVAQRLHGLEHALIGSSIGSSVRDGLAGRAKVEHLAALSPIDDVRATGKYRLDASLTLVRRALDCCLGNC